LSFKEVNLGWASLFLKRANPFSTEDINRGNIQRSKHCIYRTISELEKKLDLKQQTLILTMTFSDFEMNVVSINPDLMQTFAVFKNTIFY